MFDSSCVVRYYIIWYQSKVFDENKLRLNDKEMILARFYKIISILLIFFSIFVFFSLYPTFSITKFVVKKNYEYFVLGNNFNKIQNLYYDFVVQRYFKNNFIKQESDIKKIAKITKRYLVDQIESSEYGYDIQPTFYGVSLGQVIILGYGACESVWVEWRLLSTGIR